VSATDLEVMRRLDRLHLEFPFAGARMLRGMLSAEGCKIGRRHVKTLNIIPTAWRISCPGPAPLATSAQDIHHPVPDPFQPAWGWPWR
jgi:hypothetical protein